MRLLWTAELSGRGYTLDIDEIHVASSSDDSQSAFVGMLQNLHIDGARYFDYLTSTGEVGPLPPGIKMEIGGSGGNIGVSINETEQQLFTVTFRGRQSEESYAAFDTLQILGDTRLSLMLRSSVSDRSNGSDGILLYNGGVDSSMQQRPTRSSGSVPAMNTAVCFLTRFIRAHVTLRLKFSPPRTASLFVYDRCVST